MRLDSEHVADDVLIDLQQGLMDELGRSEVLGHLRHCADCEDRFRGIGREAELLAGRVRVQNGAVTLDSNEDARIRAGGPVPAPRGHRRAVVGAAAIAAVVLAALFLYPTGMKRSGSDGLGGSDGLDYWLPIGDEEVMLRSALDEARAGPLFEALRAYGRRDTRRVVSLLREHETPEELESLRIVLASALVWESRLDEARELLEELDVASLPQPYRDRARWILYTALVRSGQTALAEDVARELGSRPGEFFDRIARRQRPR